MKTIKKLKLIFCGIAIATLFGCDLLKNEDDKIKEALIGKYYEEDRFNDSGTNIKDIKGEFYKDGKFSTEATFELVDDDTYETTDVTINIKGDWRVKEKFIYYTFDFNSMKLTPSYYMILKEELIKTIKDKNTPDKVIEYSAAKIIYEDSDGDRHTMKKSY